MAISRDELMETVNRELVAKGKVIELGWVGFRIAALLAETPPEQIAQMRMTFFAGAHHLFRSIMAALEAGDDATPADLAMMDAIADELDRFGDQLRAEIETAGSA